MFCHELKKQKHEMSGVKVRLFPKTLVRAHKMLRPLKFLVYFNLSEMSTSQQQTTCPNRFKSIAQFFSHCQHLSMNNLGDDRIQKDGGNSQLHEA